MWSTEGRHTVCHLGGTYHSLALARVRVFEAGEALIRGVGNGHQSGHCRMKRGDVGGPWVNVKNWRCEPLSFAYFLCGGKEK